ncbi:ABC transporter substrate-binding protein [Actinotalea sp. M2MS4P-6]|uniref:ABC transporter substrate-binding protein n=1 Tax=Actinotalea sp. M2MS4P-6 TaxID=2983762 RepID=UPI0021E498EF|nr:ABC transporter substrate-binding protein [Actinotalea sp. M2MS4P-6]MCV2394451.1 ABC transporter substrate-binding protein [Actinotalea sp. M2MS4P-6]
MRRIVAAVGAAALTLGLAACGGGGGTTSSEDTSTAASDHASLVIGELSYPTGFDVNGYSIAHYVQYFNAVFDTLIRQDGDGNLVPGLATEWTYDDARTTLTLTLQDGITFTDGSPFNADAVVANVENFQASSTPDLSNAQYVESVEAVDDTHVAYHLSAPDPMLTTWLTGSFGFMAAPDSFANPDVATNPVGTGPYTLNIDKTVTGSTYVFDKNPDYWDDSYVVYDTLTINYYETQTALLNAIQGNQVDAATFMDVTSMDQVEAAGYTVYTSQLDWMGLLFYDRDGTVDKPLGDVRVRQAINYAIDKQTILDVIQLGHGTVTSQPFGEATAGYQADLDDYYGYDPEKATSLLAEAGYADGFSLDMPNSSALNQDLLSAIQTQLADVGITVTLTDTGANFITDLLGGKFTSSWMQLASANDWQFAQLALVPNATFNMFGTQSPELDALFETMQTGTDEEAAAAAQEVNTYVVENAWFAPFYRIDNFYVGNSSVVVTPAADNASPYLYLIQPAS